MKRIRNVVFRLFFWHLNFFLNWKILPFERSTFSLFYLLNVLPFVVLPYNRSTFFHSTFFNSTFCNSTFCNSTFFTGAQINFIFPFLRRTQILQRLKKPKFFYLNSISKALANFLISILYMLFTKNKILKWLASLPPVCMNDATYK